MDVEDFDLARRVILSDDTDRFRAGMTGRVPEDGIEEGGVSGGKHDVCVEHHVF